MVIPAHVLKGRIKKVQDRLIGENLTGLVIYSSGSCLGFAGRTHGYLRYLCDWDARNFASVLILIRGQEPILLVPVRSLQQFARETLWFPDIRIVPQPDLSSEILLTLKPTLLSDQKIGYVGRDEMPGPLYEAMFHGSLANVWVDASHIIDQLRIIKEDIDIDLHRRAADICDTMVNTFRREVMSGKKVYQIQADLEHTAKLEGCEYASTFLSVGSVIDRPRYAKRECSQIPKEGDQVMLALFVLSDGHWGHAVRTGSIGKPKRQLHETFKIVLEMQAAALNKIYPGSPIFEIWQASETVLNKNYPDARDQDWYWLKIGHGLGFDYSDPILSDLFPDPFNMSKNFNLQHAKHEKYACIMPGMLLEIHPNIFIPNYAAAALGDMVLTTDTGYEILNKCPRELLVF